MELFPYATESLKILFGQRKIYTENFRLH